MSIGHQPPKAATHVRDGRRWPFKSPVAPLTPASSSAKADDPVRRKPPALSHRSGIRDARWSLSSGGHSAGTLAGMTAVCRQCRLLLPLGPHEIEIAAFVGLQDGLVEQMRVTALRPFRR